MLRSQELLGRQKAGLEYSDRVNPVRHTVALAVGRAIRGLREAHGVSADQVARAAPQLRGLLWAAVHRGDLGKL